LAAEKGKVDAQLALAEMLESGEGGLAPNQTEASYWRQRANNRGFAPGKLH
jgi:TPR repeat protein